MLLKDRAWIASHVPHAGTMCLLDEVLFWNADRVRCASRAHRASDNPLRAHGRLGAACGIEFAAQAMAVHAALLASAPQAFARAGYLAGLRGVSINVTRLDDLAEDLVATAERLSGNESTVLYGFTLSAGSRTLIRGRAIVILDALTMSPSLTADCR